MMPIRRDHQLLTGVSNQRPLTPVSRLSDNMDDRTTRHGKGREGWGRILPLACEPGPEYLGMRNVLYAKNVIVRQYISRKILWTEMHNP